jgi:hypothetical protein
MRENPEVRPEVPRSKTLRPAARRIALHYARSALTRQAPFAPHLAATLSRTLETPSSPNLNTSHPAMGAPWANADRRGKDTAAIGGSIRSREPRPPPHRLRGFQPPAPSAPRRWNACWLQLTGVTSSLARKSCPSWSGTRGGRGRLFSGSWWKAEVDPLSPVRSGGESPGPLQEREAPRAQSERHGSGV